MITVFIQTILLVVELLDETRNQTLCHEAAFMFCRKVRVEGDLVKLFHVLALS